MECKNCPDAEKCGRKLELAIAGVTGWKCSHEFSLENVIEHFCVVFLIGDVSEFAGTIETMLEVLLVAYTQNERLYDDATHLYLAGHVADVAVTVVHAVGDNQDDISRLSAVAVVGAYSGEIVERTA